MRKLADILYRRGKRERTDTPWQLRTQGRQGNEISIGEGITKCCNNNPIRVSGYPLADDAKCVGRKNDPPRHALRASRAFPRN